jgi:hypothetical protein
MERLADEHERARIRGRRRLAQGHDGQQAEEADQDESALDQSRGDVGEGEALVLLLEQREQDGGATDIGEDEHELEERTQEHAPVGAGTGDVVGIAQNRSVGEDRSNRCDEREDEQHSHG